MRHITINTNGSLLNESFSRTNIFSLRSHLILYYLFDMMDEYGQFLYLYNIILSNIYRMKWANNNKINNNRKCEEEENNPTSAKGSCMFS